MYKLVIGVDTDNQKDFVDEMGALSAHTSPKIRKNIGSINRKIRIKIGSVDSHTFDAWEFQANGGPFPTHCVKGTEGWLKIPESRNPRTRFIPMSQGSLVVGESTQGEGNRQYGPEDFANEVVNKGVSGIFEKEVYSLGSNPNAAEFIHAVAAKIIAQQKLTQEEILFAIYGHCTGLYCADAAAEFIKELGYEAAIVEDAAAPLNIDHQGNPQDGTAVTRKNAAAKGIHIMNTEEVISIAQRQ